MKKTFSNSDFVVGRESKGGIIHIANIKGGVGKSTIATNLAAVLAKRGRTLIIDFDVQGNVSHAFGFSEKKNGSSLLLSKKFSDFNADKTKKHSIARFFFGALIGQGDISFLCGRAEENLYMIPADNSLWGDANFFKRQNLVHNLHFLRNNFKYIVIDTPSIWNKLSKFLYIQSDLNLIPATLNALSTRSLQDYLTHIAELSRIHPNITVRIVKNEVFGGIKDTEPKNLRGKMRTMAENRAFLNNLCRTLRLNKNGKVIAPEQIMFNIEIPESSIIRDAQDKGISVEGFKAKSSVAQAFASLADMVIMTLGMNRTKKRKSNIGIVLSVIFILIVLGFAKHSKENSPIIVSPTPPKALTPEQVKVAEAKIIRHTFKRDENFYRIAKHAISKFVGIVPTNEELDAYINETINIHNTINSAENKIKNADNIRQGQQVAFYPSAILHNRVNEEMVTVYDFFLKLLDDPYAYITGDWLERGYGEESNHDAIDVAGVLGAKVITPISGIIINKDSKNGGRITGVVSRPDAFVVYFAHLEERFFEDGDSVVAGTPIGTVGMTGRTSGPHAHIGFGIKTLDPTGVAFGRSRYKYTDPKFLYYRLAHKENGGK